MMTTTDFIFRLAVAALLGGSIGFERECRAKDAGVRTHFLVALGSALFMILSQYGFNDLAGHFPHLSYDPSRIASQVVTGIGFIGAGTIIFQKHVIKGLTTAAGLWVTSAIGLTCGSGMYTLAIATTLLVLICLETLNFIINRFGFRNLAVTFEAPDKASAGRILKKIESAGLQLSSCQIHENHTEKGARYLVTMELKIKRSTYPSNVIAILQEFNGVSFEDIE